MEKEDEDLLVIVDTEMLALCRLCTSKKGKFQIGKQMQKHMKECFDIVIDSFDGMSQIVCEICKKLVNEIVEVRERFKSNQERLLEKRKQLISQENKRPTSPIYVESDSENKKPKNETVTKSINKEPTDSELIKKSESKETNETKKHSNNKLSLKKINDTNKIPTNSTISIDSESGSSRSTSSKNKRKFKRICSNNSSESDNNDSVNLEVLAMKKFDQYNCLFCRKSFNSEQQIKSHIAYFHKSLVDLVNTVCKPCCVSLELTNEQTVSEWVKLNENKCIKFRSKNNFYNLSKANRRVNIYSSSSDEEHTARKEKSKKNYIKAGNKNTKRKSVDLFGDGCYSKSSLLQPEKGTPGNLKLLIKKGIVSNNIDSAKSADNFVSDSDSNHSNSKDNTKQPLDVSTVALSEDEITRIIESCYKTAKIKKTLTAPIKKNWIVQDLMELVSINVNWTNSPCIEVSRISITGKQTVDYVSQLPTYKNDSPLQFGHLKLLKVGDNKKPSPPASKPLITFIGKNQLIVRRPPGTEIINVPQNMGCDVQPSMPPISIVETKSLATKRPIDTDDSLAKKRCVEEPCETMTPIIVSSVSLAKGNNTLDNDTFNSMTKLLDTSMSSIDMSQIKPMIKCKPTSALMPSPIKLQPAIVQQNTGPVILNSLQPQLTISNEAPTNETNGLPVLNTMFSSSMGTTPLLSMPSVPDTQYDPNFIPTQQTSESLYPNLAPANYIPPNAEMPPNLTIGQPNEFVDINSQIGNNSLNKNSVLNRLQRLLAKKNVVFKLLLSAPVQYTKLLRFVLTIREKRVNTAHMISTEYIVEVCLQHDGVLALNVFDAQFPSTLIDVGNWSDDFQKELVLALKKPVFLQTILKVGMGTHYMPHIYSFAEILRMMAL